MLAAQPQPRKNISATDIRTALQPTPCPELEMVPAYGNTAAVPSLFSLAGLSDAAALHATLDLYLGESMLVGSSCALLSLSHTRIQLLLLTQVDAFRYVNRSVASFSRGGGITAGLLSIPTRHNDSVAFICDVDMVVSTGTFSLCLCSHCEC
jgi:hypothetical protein